ncbi:MAG: hypothetical protein Q8S33_17170 [Myxococcales bacterium]|nr:hypothetical protein [Myxococcales bacterium]
MSAVLPLKGALIEVALQSLRQGAEQVWVLAPSSPRLVVFSAAPPVGRPVTVSPV